jgi:hypothetical protein
VLIVAAQCPYAAVSRIAVITPTPGPKPTCT